MKAQTQNKLRNKYITSPEDEEKPVIKLNVDIDDSFKKKPKKTYTPLRVEDDIMEGFREYVRINKLESHGVIMNYVLKNFLIENNIKIG